MAKGYLNTSSNNGLPANPEAERLLLGFLLRNGENLFGHAEHLRPADFSILRNQRIFDRMRQLYRRGEEINYVSVYLELQEHKETEHDTLNFLMQLTEGIPETRSITSYVNKVRDAAFQQRLFHVGHKQMLYAAHPDREMGEVMTQCRQELEELSVLYRNGSESFSRLENLPSVWQAEVKMEFLIEGLMLSGAVTMLAGESGDGKSTFALALAGAVAWGIPFLGRATLKRPVLYMDRENPVYVVKDRLQSLGIAETPDLKIWGNWWQEPPGADDPEIVEWVRKHKALVVIDSLIAFARCDENDSHEMRRHMEVYKRLAYAGGSVLVIHHRSDKGEANYRGSSDIKAVLDAAWILSRSDGSDSADRLDQLELKDFKTRGMVGNKIRLQFGETGFIPIDKPPKPTAEIALDMVILYPGSTQKELRKLAPKHGLADQRLVDALNSLVLAGNVEIRTGNHNTKRYHLREVYLTQGV